MYYKTPDNQLHCPPDGIDPYTLPTFPQDAVPISDEQAESIRQSYSDPKALIIAQILSLEQSQLMPRATREFMLLMMEAQFTPEQLALNFGYSAVKAFDNQIKSLRDQL